MRDAGALLRSNGILFLGMSVGNAINYAFQLLMARLLGPRAYGDFAAVYAYLFILTAVSSILQANVALEAGRRWRAPREWTRIYGVTLACGILFSAALSAAAPRLAQALGLPGPAGLLAINLALPLVYLLAIQYGRLQGERRFVHLSLNHVAQAALKLPLAVALVLAGLGHVGPLVATTASFLLVVVLAGMVPHLREPEPHQARGGAVEWRTLSWSVMALLGVTLLRDVDILLANARLQGEGASYYAAAATVGNIALFLVTPVALVMTPHVQGAVGAAKRRIFHLSLGATLLLLAPFLAATVLAPSLVARLLFGDAFASSAPVLPLLGAAGASLALAQLAVLYVLARGGRSVGPLMLGAGAAHFAVFALVTPTAAAFGWAKLGVCAAAAVATLAVAVATRDERPA